MSLALVAAGAPAAAAPAGSAASGAVLADLAVPTRVRLLRPSPDGLTLLTLPSFTGKAAQPVLWDLERYRLVAQLESHVGFVYSARFVDLPWWLALPGRRDAHCRPRRSRTRAR